MKEYFHFGIKFGPQTPAPLPQSSCPNHSDLLRNGSSSRKTTKTILFLACFAVISIISLELPIARLETLSLIDYDVEWFEFSRRLTDATSSEGEEGEEESKRLCGMSSSAPIVGFWHIGESNKATDVSRDDFVKMQLGEIQDMHLFDKCNDYDVTLNYVTRVQLSDETKDLLRSDERIRELPPTSIENMDDNEEYFEFPTLMEMHSYCSSLPQGSDAIVFYIHSKTQDSFRLAMEKYMLGPSCVSCLQDPSMMACGPNHINDSWKWAHFSGNFFMTRCEHIRQLNPPLNPIVMDEMHTIQEFTKGQSSGHPHAYPPFGRYVAEYWVLNDAGDRPDHVHDISEWPYLSDNSEGQHKSLIHKDQICSKGLAF